MIDAANPHPISSQSYSLQRETLGAVRLKKYSLGAVKNNYKVSVAKLEVDNSFLKSLLSHYIGLLGQYEILPDLEVSISYASF